MQKTYNRTNFHKHTYCVFTTADKSRIEGIQPAYQSKSGSRYYFTDQGVYRLSNHWGRAANCRWRLVGPMFQPGRTQLGYASWGDFFPDNDWEKLYFLKPDFKQGSVQFYHKNSPDYEDGVVLRTAPQTMERIKLIRRLLETTDWARYLNGDVEILRKQIIERLINSAASFQQIRKAYL